MLFKFNFGQRSKTNVVDKTAKCFYGVVFSFSATEAVAASNTGVHAAVTLGAAAQDVATAITNPVTPRGIRIKGNAADIAGDVVITGTNALGEEITETIALNGSSAVDGAKAFKTITNIHLPAKTNTSGDTVSVGWSDILGLPYLLPINTVIRATHDGTVEGTPPTVTVSATAIESNTIDLNTALNGKVVTVWLDVMKF